MEDAFIGEIRPFAFGFCPQSWLPCNGGTYAIAQFQALYAVIGIQYGGNAQTNFQVPNLQGRVVVSPNPQDDNFFKNGIAGGTETVQMNLTELPPHNHNVQTFKNTVPADFALTTNVPGNSVYFTDCFGFDAASKAHSMFAYSNADDMNTNQLNPSSIGLTPSTYVQPHQNMAPYVAFTYCICWDGEFPLRP